MKSTDRCCLRKPWAIVSYTVSPLEREKQPFRESDVMWVKQTQLTMRQKGDVLMVAPPVDSP